MYDALAKHDCPRARHSWRTARTLGYDVELGRVNNRNRACWRDPSKEQYLFVGWQTGLFRPGKQVLGCLAMQ